MDTNLPGQKAKLKIVLLEDIHSEVVNIFNQAGFTNIERLPSALNGQELIHKIHDAHIVGIRSATHIGKDIIAQCPGLMAIGCFCIGTNQVDVDAAMHMGMPVFNDPHSNTRSVAELIIGLCIVLMRDLFKKNAAARIGKWRKTSHGAHEIRGKTLGIVGYGLIGTQVSILAEAMGMHVCYYDVEKKLSIGNVKALTSLEELLAISDIVTLHVPETPSTCYMMNKEHFQLMKKTAFLINTSRGKVVDDDAIYEALESKAIAGAALDVFQQEPANASMPFTSPLQKLDNVILTPHIGGSTEEAQMNIMLTVSKKIINFLCSGTTEGAVNFPILSLPPNEHTHRILHIHHNIPGVLFQINRILAENGINIYAQYLKTTQEIGYVVFDIEKKYEDTLIDVLTKIKGTIRARILY